MDFNRILSGMIRAAKLETAFYEEVEHDPSYSQDALMVVIIAAVASAIGTFIGGLFSTNFFQAILGLIFGAAVSVGVYFLWVFLVHLIGTRLFKGQADFGEVQRALGFAWAPRAITILSFIPFLGVLIGILAWFWSVATGFVATRQALDLDNTNAALTVIISAIVAFLVQAVIWSILGLIGIAGAAVLG
jgi:hypothetical protein